MAWKLDDTVLPTNVIHSPQSIRECAKQIANIDGDVAEIGVYEGESALLMAELFPGLTLHLFDTFSGHPEEMWDAIDAAHPPKKFGDTSLEAVRFRLNLTGQPYRIYEGIFPDTAVELFPLRFVHVDCDLYRSTKAAMEWAWKNLASGGIVLNDDYGSVAGAKTAVQEFSREFDVEMIPCKDKSRVYAVKP